MYLIRTATERSRNRILAKQIVGADVDTAHRLIMETLPEHVAAITGPAEIEGMRRRLLGLKPDGRATLRPRDYLEALGIFLLVVIATFPVVLPFLFMNNAARALHASQAITLGMLLFAGLALGLAVMFTLAPATRWGYFVYPIGLVGWMVLTRPPSADAADKTAVPVKMPAQAGLNA
jgi:VIT1/CCC1 family predicted Fe2+/Mn2+ transporter